MRCHERIARGPLWEERLTTGLWNVRHSGDSVPHAALGTGPLPSKDDYLTLQQAAC